MTNVTSVCRRPSGIGFCTRKSPYFPTWLVDYGGADLEVNLRCMVSLEVLFKGHWPFDYTVLFHFDDGVSQVDFSEYKEGIPSELYVRYLMRRCIGVWVEIELSIH